MRDFIPNKVQVLIGDTRPGQDPSTNPAREMSDDTGSGSVPRNETALEAKHKVFLSHSGAQKAFVEQLCVDLERCDRYPFFDKRRDSLGIGEHFPNLIFQAIQQCQVGVLILSEEFFTRTKWPMLELAAMVESKTLNPELVIMPVFLSISREQCRNGDNHHRWVSSWLEWARKDTRINVTKWKEALSLFGPTNALIYNDTVGEVKFREEIVEAICERVRPETRWDDSHVQGRTRFCKVIREKMETTQMCETYGVRVVGLYGVGGIGKTTICKALCNDYFREFQGRVAHVELESASKVELMRGMLRKLTDTRHDVLAGFDTGECSTQLKAKVHKHKVFLAIDNVSDTGEVLDQATSILGAGFKQGSVVVVAARSIGQLMCTGISKGDCMEIPKLNPFEARSLFLRQVPGVPDESIIKEDEDCVMHCVELCRFLKGDQSSFDYLPLALKVLGVQLGCVGYDPKQWVALVEQEPDTFNQLRERENPIFAFLRRSFDALRDEDQLLFMDVVLYCPKDVMASPYHINIFDWLSMVHRISVQLVKLRLEALKRKSVIEELGERIGVHDLWREFAKEETKAGQLEYRRWVYVNDDDRSEFDEPDPSGNRWGNMRRMCFLGTGMESFKSVNLQYCSNVTVLHLIGYLEGIEVLDLGALKYLKSLMLYNWHFADHVDRVRGLGSLKSLGLLVWEDEFISAACMDDIARLTNLQILRISCTQCSKLPDLTNLKSLRVVQFDVEGEVNKVSGLSYKLTRLQHLYLRFCNESVTCSCYGICNVMALQELEIEGYVKVEEVFNLQKLTNLQRLSIDDCQRIKALPGLSDLVGLESFHLRGCDCECGLQLGSLRSLPEISKLTKLQKLDISWQNFITGLEGLSDAVSLQEIRAAHCCELREFPEISKLTNLRVLDVSWCSVKTIPGLGELVALQELLAQHCSELCEIPDLHKLANLKTLDLRWCSLRIVPGLGELEALERFFAHHCSELVELPDMRKLKNLRLLDVSHCCSLKALPPLDSLPALQNVKGDLQTVENSSDLHTLPKLMKVKVIGWSSRGVHCAKSLEFLTIRDCRELNELFYQPNYLPRLTWLKLKRCDFRSVSELVNFPMLSHLEIFFCSELQSVSDLHHLTNLRIEQEEVSKTTRLRTVINISNLPKLKYLDCRYLAITELPDLSLFPQLNSLEVCNCEELRSLKSSGPLTSLETLTIDSCRRLRSLPDLRSFTNLESLAVRRCGVRLTEPDTDDCETTSWPRVEWELVPADKVKTWNPNSSE